jgi:hypothetical protein
MGVQFSNQILFCFRTEGTTDFTDFTEKNLNRCYDGSHSLKTYAIAAMYFITLIKEKFDNNNLFHYNFLYVSEGNLFIREKHSF